MVRIKIDENELLEQLNERVKFWTDDEDTQALFSKMYENYIFGGCFEDCEVDIMAIVDNDCVNWCYTVDESDENYNNIKKLYEENGIGDISTEENNGGYSFIEAEHNGLFLVRA